MEYQFFEIEQLPIVVVDKFFSEEESQQMLNELNFLNSRPEKLFGVESTGSAFETLENGEKKFIKKNRGVFLDDVYSNRNFSDILNINRKLFDSEFVGKLIQKHYFFRYIKECNFDRTLIQYYENSDYYDFHIDTVTITAITWFYNKPKRFTGGDILFKNGLTVECGYNRTLIFPSILEHSVSQINLDSNEKNSGRYSITQFICLK
jgi:hypothetical protein